MFGKWPLWLANVTCGQSGNSKAHRKCSWIMYLKMKVLHSCKTLATTHPTTQHDLDRVLEDGGATFLQNVGNHTPNNTA
jgi:hypothetical protein